MDDLRHKQIVSEDQREGAEEQRDAAKRECEIWRSRAVMMQGEVESLERFKVDYEDCHEQLQAALIQGDRLRERVLEEARNTQNVEVLQLFSARPQPINVSIHRCHSCT